jgi:hypothetical protein
VSAFDLRALEVVFLAIEQAGLDVILVGGHAVSFYAAKYREHCPELLLYLPLLSKDGDWIGTVDDGMRLAFVYWSSFALQTTLPLRSTAGLKKRSACSPFYRAKLCIVRHQLMIPAEPDDGPINRFCGNVRHRHER